MDDKEQIVELKSKIEKAIQDFNSYLKQINALGFACQIQPDFTAYIFRDIREAYGEQKKQEVKAPVNEEKPV